MTPRTTRSNKTAAAVLTSLAFGLLAQASSAEARTYQLCSNALHGAVCIDFEGGEVGFYKNGEATVQQAQHQISLQSGNYIGTWKDGTNMVDRIVMGKGILVAQRLAGGHGSGATGPEVTFFQTSPSEYTNHHGSKIFVTSPTSFTWSNKRNANHVFFQMLH